MKLKNKKRELILKKAALYLFEFYNGEMDYFELRELLQKVKLHVPAFSKYMLPRPKLPLFERIACFMLDYEKKI